MSSRKLTTRRTQSFPAALRRADTGRSARGKIRLVIEANVPDPEAVSSAIREWIVPVLVREYLAERAARVGSLATTSLHRLDTEPIGKEQRDNPATSQ
jgi:hypothetical protein